MMPTAFQLHVAKWKDCTRCELHTQRDRVVLARGKIPCDVLFIGEAPGESEDAIGQPFVGPAGQLLDTIIERAQPKDLRLAFTNLVACFPADAKETGDHEPPRESIIACAPRLDEFMMLARPKLFVCVGKLSDRWVSARYPSMNGRCTIDHPAFILRSNVAVKGILKQRAVVTLQEAFDQLESGDKKPYQPVKVKRAAKPPVYDDDIPF